MNKLPEGWRYAKVGEQLTASTMFFNIYTKTWQQSQAVLVRGKTPMICQETGTFIIPKHEP